MSTESSQLRIDTAFGAAQLLMTKTIATLMGTRMAAWKVCQGRTPAVITESGAECILESHVGYKIKLGCILSHIFLCPIAITCKYICVTKRL